MNERRTKRRFDTGSTSTAPPPPSVLNQYPWPREREEDPIPLFDHFTNTRTAANGLECRNRAITNTWDDYYSIFYNEWLKLSIDPTRFVETEVIRLLGIRSDLEAIFVDLGMGNIATNPHVLYPELIRQFMATVQVNYAHERVRTASEGILSFFICGICYRVPLSALSTIYGFQNTELQHAVVPGFAGRLHFWEHIATGIFDSGPALQTDIRHSTLRSVVQDGT
ncbi:hypothetical protein Bca101_007467 [Brassica carinata]